MLKTAAAVLAVILMTAVPALIQGRYLNRWGEPAQLDRVGRQLHQFPRQVQSWQCDVDQPPLSDAVCRELGLESHFHRQYHRADADQPLDVLLMVGPPGRLVRHPPDVCYTNRANQQVGEATPLEIVTQSGKHEFVLLRFKRTNDPRQGEFLVAYAYATDRGRWSTPTSPRLAFGAATVLYKLQVLAEVSGEASHAEIREFLQSFVVDFSSVLSGENTQP